MRSRSGAAAREREFSSFWFVSTLVIVGLAVWAMTPAIAAVGAAPGPGYTEEDADDVITGSVPHGVGYSTNVRMQFFQEDGPRAGHVKVVLTPDDRPLSVDEARSAARQAFLETLNDPVFIDGLKIVTVVVHRYPGEDELGLEFHFLGQRAKDQIRINNLNRFIRRDVFCIDRPLFLHIDGDLLRILTVVTKNQLFNIEHNLRSIFHHAVHGCKFVKHPFNLNV